MEKERVCREEKSSSRHQPKKGAIGQSDIGLLQRQGNRQEEAASRGKECEQNAGIFGLLSAYTETPRKPVLCDESLVRRDDVSSFLLRFSLTIKLTAIDSFMNWHLPFRALARQFPQLLNHPSPFGPAVSTPSDVSIATPPGNAPGSPVLSQALRSKLATERAQLFIADKQDDLLRSLSMKEKK